MPIVIEEVSGEIVPEPRGNRAGDGQRGQAKEPSAEALKMEERVRSVLVRERRRALRLSDR